MSFSFECKHIEISFRNQLLEDIQTTTVLIDNSLTITYPRKNEETKTTLAALIGSVFTSLQK